MNVKCRASNVKPLRFPFPVLTWRNLTQQRLRAFLSALAVALGAAMIIAAAVISGAILNLLSSPDLQTIGAGLFGQLKPILTFLGGAVAAAAGFLVFNAFLMAVTQRRRELGALRAVGMTRKQVLSLVLFEALLVGGVGTLWLLGWALLLPDLIGATARAVRSPLTRLWGATGRLIADNLARGRLRVSLTVATLALGLLLIAGMSGFITFMFDELFGPTFQRTLGQEMFAVATFDSNQGVAGYAGMESLALPAGLVDEIRTVLGARARVTAWRFSLAPELVFLLKDYFSFVFLPEEVWQNQAWVFRFTEGDWEQVHRWSEQEPCVVLIAPLVARNNAVAGAPLAPGDALTVHAPGGEVLCRVGGIGQGYVNASIVIAHDLTPFAAGEPFLMVVEPAPGVARDALLVDMQAMTARYGTLHILELDAMTDMILEVMVTLDDTFNAFLLLAIVAAALGVVNTTMMSITERARELALLRSLGATRRQVWALVVGEAALMGALGDALGLIVGVGIAVILPLAYGGNGFGLPDLDLRGAAIHSAQPALINGLVGLLAAPLICAIAAYSIVPGPYFVFRKDRLRTTKYALRNTLCLA